MSIVAGFSRSDLFDSAAQCTAARQASPACQVAGRKTSLICAPECHCCLDPNSSFPPRHSETSELQASHYCPLVDDDVTVSPC